MLSRKTFPLITALLTNFSFQMPWDYAIGLKYSISPNSLLDYAKIHASLRAPLWIPQRASVFFAFFGFMRSKLEFTKEIPFVCKKFEMATSILEDLCISGFVRWNVCSFQKWKETSEVLLACNSGENGTQRNINALFVCHLDAQSWHLSPIG